MDILREIDIDLKKSTPNIDKVKKILSNNGFYEDSDDTVGSRRLMGFSAVDPVNWDSLKKTLKRTISGVNMSLSDSSDEDQVGDEQFNSYYYEVLTIEN